MKFTATLDKKFEVWQRLDISFEAEDEAEAKELLEKWDGTPPDVDYINTETLYDTEEAMTVTDNGGAEVWELQGEIRPE